jgi:hypothetical protein
VLGADLLVPVAPRLAERELQNLLGPRRERDLPGRGPFTRPHDLHDLLTDVLGGDPKRSEHLSDPAVAHTKQAEQHMLGPDVRVPQTKRLLLGEDNDLTRGLCESLEQVPRIAPAQPSRKDAISGWVSSQRQAPASSTLPITW